MNASGSVTYMFMLEYKNVASILLHETSRNYRCVFHHSKQQAEDTTTSWHQQKIVGFKYATSSNVSVSEPYEIASKIA